MPQTAASVSSSFGLEEWSTTGSHDCFFVGPPFVYTCLGQLSIMRTHSGDEE